MRHLSILVLSILFLAPPSHADPAFPSAASSDSLHGSPLFGRKDLWFGAATIGAVALATKLDRWSAEEAPENSGALAVHLSRGAEHMGNPLYIIPAFLLLRGADALEHRPDRAGSLMRIAEGTAAAAVAAVIVKEAAGRARPYQAPGDQDVVRPFSGNASFPSGHTTVAFGLASAIDQETRARWVPFVVYPLAAAVGWSRLRDDQHWMSDVVAGAGLGTWTARKVVRLARRAIR